MGAVRFLSAILILSCAGVGVVDAQAPTGRPTKPAAVKSFRDGNAAYQLGNFAEALRAYEEAWKAEPAPLLHWNLGQCHRQLGHWKEALWQFDRYVASGLATPEDRKLLDQLVPEMKQKLEDEERRKEEERRKQMAPSTPPHSGQAIQNITVVHEPFYRDTVGLVLTGSGVALLGVSGGFFLSASGLRDDANATPDQREQDAIRERADSRSQVGIALGVVGGVATIVGAIKLAINPDRIVTKDQITWNVAPTSSGFVVWGRF